MRLMQRLKRRRTGFTLVEMLVVMSIVAVLGVLTALSMVAIGRRSSREGAAEDVMGILRQARLSAVDSGRGALVRISSVERTLYGLSSTIEAAWHFEEVLPFADTTRRYVEPSEPDVDIFITPGAKSMPARPRDNTGDFDDNPPLVVADGAVGLCLDFDSTSQQYVNCGRYPVYDPTDGIRVEAYVRPEGVIGPAFLGVMSKYHPNAPANLNDDVGYSLGLFCPPGAQDTYEVHGGLCLRDAGGAYVALHLVSANTLAASHWYHVALEFDGFEGRLFVNGVLVDLDSYRPFPEDAGADPNPVPDPNPRPTDKGFIAPARIVPARGQNLEIGRFLYSFPPGTPAVYHYFEGRIDEPKVLSVAGGRRVALPERVPIIASDPVIHFDRQGHLDIAYHSGPVCIALGDPYQRAELALDLNLGDPVLTLRPNNPFPPTRGIVLVGAQDIGYEVMQYASVNGLDLTVLYRPRAWGLHTAGEEVLHGRLVGISPTGTVRRATGLP